MVASSLCFLPPSCLCLFYALLLADRERDNAAGVLSYVDRAGLLIERHRGGPCQAVGNDGRRIARLLEVRAITRNAATRDRLLNSSSAPSQSHSYQGEVYVATDKMGRKVALKLLSARLSS